MTDTRKEFEEWFWSAGIGGRGELIISEKSWQACKSLNDKRIQQLLAVIAVHKDALKAAQNAIDEYEYTGTNEVSEKYIIAERLCAEAIAINPEDVELVEVGDFGGKRLTPKDTHEFYGLLKSLDLVPDMGDKLFTIKHKE